MRKYLPYILIISLVLILVPTVHSAEESPHDSLDDMLAIIEKKEKEKEKQARQFEELRLKREAEEQKRLAEIERLKKEQERLKKEQARLKKEQAMKRLEEIREDIRKYEKIVSSEYGRDMKRAAWNDLVSRHPEASGLTVGNIKGFKLRLLGLSSLYKALSVSEVQSMPNVSIREKTRWGFDGHSTINHDYSLKTIRGEKVVVDNATGLMWHQSGSDDVMEWGEAKEWIKKLNKSGYAGYDDWRLPTLEEAASLLESSKRNGNLHIDPVFSNEQFFILTGDRHSSEDTWSVNFGRGRVIGHEGGYDFVRPVRSVLSKDVEPSYQSGRDTGQVQDKSDARVHYNLGRDYNVLDMHKEAIESYKQAIRIDPDHVEAHNNLGVAYGELGRYQEAIESYKQAIRIDPDHAEAHNNLGNAYLQLNDRDSAPADLSLPQAPIAIVKQEPEPVVNKWTLRIISYSNTKKHLKQAANLAKAIKNMTGYNTFLAKIGKEIVVCAGRFNLKDSSELKEALKRISKLEYEGKRQFESSYAIQIK